MARIAGVDLPREKRVEIGLKMCIRDRVVKGGRNMRFTALVVVGDKNGHVGAGLGKAAEIPEAIRKGKEDALKSMVNVKLDENNSITHDVCLLYTSWIKIFPEKPVTHKPMGVRMGKGKGALEYWVAVVKPGRVDVYKRQI